MNKLILKDKEYQLSDDLVKHLEQTITEQDEVKVGRWVPIKGEVYYFVQGGGEVGYRAWRDDQTDIYRLGQGNVYSLEDEAYKHYMYLRALATIKEDAEWWVPDWEDNDQNKWYINFDHSRKDLTLDYARDVQEMGVVYFEDSENLKQSRDTHRKEWLTIFGIED